MTMYVYIKSLFIVKNDESDTGIEKIKYNNSDFFML